MGNVPSQQTQFVWCPATASITASTSFSKSPIADDNHNLFTDDEKNLIRKTWSQLQQQPVVNDDERIAVNRGVRVFLAASGCSSRC